MKLFPAPSGSPMNFLQQAGSSRVFSLFHPYIGQNGLPPGVKRALGWAEVAKKPISAHGLPSF